MKPYWPPILASGMTARAQGLDRMRALAAQLPDQFANGYRDGTEAARGTLGPRPRPTYAVGIGGSAISGDLARVVFERETKVPLVVVRGPALPAAADRDSLAILLSHSGTSWEAVSAYDEARRKGMRMVAITSGGELAERAERDGVPLIVINPDMPPRCSVGLVLGSILGLLDAWFPESNEDRVGRIADRLRAQHAIYAAHGGLPARLAARLGRRLPFVYGDGPLLPVARRWATQLEENAKRLATFDEVPETYHNAIVAWDRLARSDGHRLATFFLEWEGTHPKIRASNRYFERMVARKGVRTLRVAFDSSDLLEALLEGTLVGDLTSLELAARGRVDPLAIDAIARYRDFLAGSSAREAAARRS